MPTLIDTTAWSAFLRRPRRTREADPSAAIVRMVAELLAAGEARIIGAIRQEVLSGVRTPEQFVRLRDFLRGVDDESATTRDHERAAEFNNICRRGGVQGSSTDFLLCAVANRLDAHILTADGDFLRFRELLPINLLDPAATG